MGLIHPEGCCDLVRLAGGNESTGKDSMDAEKTNIHQVTPSISGSHANKEEDECQI